MITNFSFEAETILGIPQAVLLYNNGSLLRCASKQKKNEHTHTSLRSNTYLPSKLNTWQQEAKYQPGVHQLHTSLRQK